ncbi:MAG: hypothetical protein Q4D60_01155 [Eubacteriales bacterium]|nr:hypothetical protein [Eubacteriales bacterium]
MITIEMSVLIPILSVIITATLFLFLFFLDMAAARGEAMRVAGEMAAAWKTGGELATGNYEEKELIDRNVTFLIRSDRRGIVSEAESRLRERIAERLAVTRIEDVGVSIKTFRAKASVTLRFRWPLASAITYMGAAPSFSCTASAPVENREEWLRAREGFK